MAEDEADEDDRAPFNAKWTFLTGVLVSFAVVVTVGLAVAAIGLTESKVSSAAPAGSTVDGAQIYAARCAQCHGDQGEGGLGPELAGVVADKYPDVALQVLVVETGRNAMPSFRSTLTREQIAAVVDYERTELGR